MKTRILISIAMLLLTFVNSNAQSWNITGNSLSTTGIFGSTSSGNDINFVNDNTTAMTLKTSSLYLGIGTTTPGGTLDVFNNTNNSSTPNMYLSYSGSIRTSMRISSTGNLLIFPQNGGSDKNVAIQSAGGSAATYKLTIYGDIGAQTIPSTTSVTKGMVWDNSTSQFKKPTPFVDIGDKRCLRVIC